jgi:glycosyltransferase involved in cell wall biosynthesis
MHLRDGSDVLVADESEAFAQAVLRLLGDDALWRKLSAGGLDNTAKHFSPDAARPVLEGLLESLPER